MTQTLRHPQILDLARRQGRVTVDALARYFEVTHQTIRRDLADLTESGRLERVHGGAVLPSGTANIGYEERRRLNHASKQEMARVVADLVPHNASVFLNIGTSTEAVAQELLHHKGLLVVTNNLNVATILAGNSECEVVLTGGRLRAADGGLVGTLAVDTVKQFKFDVAVIGCSALDLDGDLLDFDLDEVRVAQVILSQSRTAVAVADHSKLQRTAPARIASLAELQTLVTDATLPQSLMQRCADWGVNVLQTKKESL